MTLRQHQAELQAVALRIAAGEPIKEIVLAVTPGGGKSASPVILASILIPKIADRMVWVVPRNALKYQGEAEFVEPRWNTPIRLRAASGNEPAPDRSAQGYLTTYQAVGIKPEHHQAYVRKHRTILFLDEPHHVADDAEWAAALAPMVRDAVLVVYASGTLSRNDGQRIFGLEYDGPYVNLRRRPSVEVIVYGRRKAIEDGAILAPKLMTIDGAAEWISKQGVRRSVDSLAGSGDDRADAVYTALRTDFAFALLGACLEHWREHRKVYPRAKLLVVAPDIETAKTYQQRLAAAMLSEIATSDDNAAAHRAIEDFRRGAIDGLVTVGKAYEGLSVPEITHTACLTAIRSWPWLEQLGARGNRLAPGKTDAWIFAPADRAMIEAWEAIENESLVPLADEPAADGGSSVPGEESGLPPVAVQPLWSQAHGIDAELPAAPELPPSVAEAVLRENLAQLRRVVVDQARPGSQKARATVWSYTLRGDTGKDVDEMDAQELTAAWMRVREKFKRVI